MQKQDQTEFFLERMQPDWLEEGWSRPLYTMLTRLLFGFILGIILSVVTAMMDALFQNNP